MAAERRGSLRPGQHGWPGGLA